MSEQSSWYDGTGLEGLAHAPDRLWWWVVAEHLTELRYLVHDLPLTAEQRKRVLRLSAVHAHELSTMAGHPVPPGLAAHRAAAPQDPDEHDAG